MLITNYVSDINDKIIDIFLPSVKGEDFMINDTEVTFYYQGNMTEVCLELVIVNDLFIEDLERFTIDVVPNNPYDRILGNNRTEISIEDNDCKLL